MASMRSKISQALETENVSVVDTSGDGRHVAIDVVSPAFEGLNAVKRQRLVYKVGAKCCQMFFLNTMVHISSSPRRLLHHNCFTLTGYLGGAAGSGACSGQHDHKNTR